MPFLIELSHELMSKIQPVVTSQKNTFGRQERTTYYTYKAKAEMVQKILGKATSPNKQKERRKKHVWLSGRLHIEGRLNKGPRLQRKHKDEKRSKAKHNKTNVTPEKDVMTSASQTPGGCKFASLVASEQGRANQHEPACFGLSSPWSFPSRSGIPLHGVVQPWLSLQRPISP